MVNTKFPTVDEEYTSTKKLNVWYLFDFAQYIKIAISTDVALCVQFLYAPIMFSQV